MIIYIIRIVDNQNFFNRALTQQVNIQYIQIYNTHFATFREKYGLGEDFIVLSHVKDVDHMLRFSYDTDL